MAYIFFTSPTSGTASMQRIVQAVAGDKRKVVRLGRRAASEPGEDAFHLDPDAGEIIYWFQGPRHWNPEIDLSPFRTIVHFRDPRDLACNQYWWALQHPNDKDSPEVVEQKRRDVEAQGINEYVRRNYVKKNRLAGLFDIFRDIGSRPDASGATYTSYAQLCCAFDYMVDNLCSAFGTAPTSVLDELRGERPENLAGNTDWVKVGGTWQGSDISPGRFRKELEVEMVGEVTAAYQRDLAFCREKDAPFLAVHYY